MKKLFTLLALAAFLISCEGPSGADGIDGQGVNWTIRTFTIQSNEWVVEKDADGLNAYYMCEKPYPELTDFIYEQRNVNGYMYISYPQVEVQVPLPYVIPWENTAGDEWTETYSFDFTRGSVAFYVHYSDFVEIQPPTQVFRVVLAW